MRYIIGFHTLLDIVVGADLRDLLGDRNNLFQLSNEWSYTESHVLS
jgi:hypothetical protein